MPGLQESLHSHVRIDGHAKVCGRAQFAADFTPENTAYAAIATSSIACGEILGFELESARGVPGVLAVYTHQDMAGCIQPVKHLMAGGYANSSAVPLGSSRVFYAGQIIALVIAESKESADEAAQNIGVRYQEQAAVARITDGRGAKQPLSSVRTGHKDARTGNVDGALAKSPVRVNAEYRTPIQHHNPIELFGTTCQWHGEQLTVYEATRYIYAAQHGLAAQLSLAPDQIRIVCPFLGGHFGSRLALSQYTAPVAIAARRLGRPVKYVATRSQGFTIANHRPDTIHRVEIGADTSGRFTAFTHHAEVTSSRFDDFVMIGTDVTARLYDWPNVETKEMLVRVDRNTPGPMRAPPEVPYLFALESAMDEVASMVGIDPIELRRRNDPQKDAIDGKPFKPHPLMQCFDAGAAAFGWSSRNPRPSSMRDGDWLVGYGCASAVRPVKRAAAILRLTLLNDGHALIETAHHEIGNGIYTVLAIEAAKYLGIDIAAVTVRLGDSSLPPAGISGGSSTTTSLVPALVEACRHVRQELFQSLCGIATFSTSKVEDFRLESGRIVASNGPPMNLVDAFSAIGKDRIERLQETAPPEAPPDATTKLWEGKLGLTNKEEELKWAYGAQFAEVRVHAVTREIAVTRLTGAFWAGSILNRLTAVSQLRGGMIWGLGSAILEATEVDGPTARYVNDNLTEYHVATAADYCAVDAIILGADVEHEPSELMGVGELGIIGVNAAIANALYHATGTRVRALPIRVDDLVCG
ncbi:MAG: xanthine dehydrogenase family protein molybdopterin-binding subunit [Bryobacteraceae bacterium]